MGIFDIQLVDGHYQITYEENESSITDILIVKEDVLICFITDKNLHVDILPDGSTYTGSEYIFLNENLFFVAKDFMTDYLKKSKQQIHPIFENILFSFNPIFP